MPKQATFKVSQKGVEPITVNFVEPESLTDTRWTELGITPEQINELAVQNLVIKVQGVVRGKLSEGKGAVQKAVDEYKYGQRGTGGTRKVTIAAEQVKTLKFTEEQLAALRAAGVSIPGMEEPAAAASGAPGKGK